MKNKKLLVLVWVAICSLLFASCSFDDTYKLAKRIRNYEINGDDYKDALKMARKGNYDANCKECFRGIDAEKISLFAYACEVDYEIAQEIYDNGADIDVSNSKYPMTPLLAALRKNRNNTEIIYWLIDEGADINAIAFDNRCVFHYLKYWDDNDETRALIQYFKDNCDIDYLREKTEDSKTGSFDDLWDEDGEFIFYGDK